MKKLVYLSSCFGSALLILSVLILKSPQIHAAAASPCGPTDTTSGSAPCYDKAGGQCTYNDLPSTCGPSPNNSNCTCTPVKKTAIEE